MAKITVTYEREREPPLTTTIQTDDPIAAISRILREVQNGRPCRVEFVRNDIAPD